LGFHANLAPAGFRIKRRTESRDCLRKILLISAHFLTGAQAATTQGRVTKALIVRRSFVASWPR